MLKHVMIILYILRVYTQYHVMNIVELLLTGSLRAADDTLHAVDASASGLPMPGRRSAKMDIVMSRSKEVRCGA